MLQKTTPAQGTKGHEHIKPPKGEFQPFALPDFLPHTSLMLLKNDSMKSYALQLDLDLALAVGKAIWESWPDQTRTDLLKLLLAGHSPQHIESTMKTVIDRQCPQLPKWKRMELAGRYYTGSLYALKNNLHLN